MGLGNEDWEYKSFWDWWIYTKDGRSPYASFAGVQSIDHEARFKIDFRGFVDLEGYYNIRFFFELFILPFCSRQLVGVRSSLFLQFGKFGMARKIV